MALDLGLSLAQRTGARIAANHVYAARMHEARFHQMKPGLPDRYQEDEQLQKLRGTHDMIIDDGLQLISDAYLEIFENRAREMKLKFASHTPEGHHYVELLRVLDQADNDLAVLGSLGLGRVQGSLIGGVAERVLRHCSCDLLLARRAADLSGARIPVSVDGSQGALAAVQRAARLAAALGATLEPIAVFDPFFHSGVFGAISEVLSAEDAERFDFQAQERLHDEIIDRGLESIYAEYLSDAEMLASSEGAIVQTRLLQGKAFDQINQYAGDVDAALVVVGRHGAHREPLSLIGSTAENVARLSPTNVLVIGPAEEHIESGRSSTQRAESLEWDPAAETRLENVPRFARRVARRGIEEYAREHGHSRVTLDVYMKARMRLGR
jgi:nucleotide-binding universal stress UspA family protein